MEPINLYQQWADAFASIGLSHISTETAAKLLAILYVYGGSSEDFTHTPRLLTDIQTAQRMFNIEGGEEPSPEGVLLIQKYIKELNDDIVDHQEFKNGKPAGYSDCQVGWANDLMIGRYGFKKLRV
ncbi:MAG: hypothetical protein ACI30W_01355 [Muribaculaceae bacterium]